jgi:hypothetical protein
MDRYKRSNAHNANSTAQRQIAARLVNDHEMQVMPLFFIHFLFALLLTMVSQPQTIMNRFRTLDMPGTDTAYPSPTTSVSAFAEPRMMPRSSLALVMVKPGSA